MVVLPCLSSLTKKELVHKRTSLTILSYIIINIKENFQHYIRVGSGESCISSSMTQITKLGNSFSVKNILQLDIRPSPARVFQMG